MNVLIFGASSGVGKATAEAMVAHGHQVTGWSSVDLDLNHPERIFEKDFSQYDILINCAAHTEGSYLGFLKNDWQRQLSQITVNYISNLFILKHYAQNRSNGKFVWISTAVMDNPRIYHSIYASTKKASKFAIDLIRHEASHIDILEIKIGSTKTNARYRAFLGTKTHEQILEEWENEGDVMEASYVAKGIVEAIDNDSKEVHIK